MTRPGRGHGWRRGAGPVALGAALVLVAGALLTPGASAEPAADSFCAMTESRPYASARSSDSARRELSSCSGRQFDPAVVTALLAALDRGIGEPHPPASPAEALT